MAPQDLRDWDGPVKKDASNLLSAVTGFDFIASFSILHTLLSDMEGITTKLQKRGLDVYQAHQMV